MSTRDLVLTALLAAVIVALGAAPPIPLSFVPVPITLQTLGVMLAGLMLGPKRGALACALVIVLVALGLPVLSGGRGGLGVLFGPTAGFLFGWIPGAFAVGLLTRRARGRGWSRGVESLALWGGAVIGGLLVVYACGVPWLALGAGLGWSKAAFGSAIFIPGDLIKSVLAVAAAQAAHRVYPLDLEAEATR